MERIIRDVIELVNNWRTSIVGFALIILAVYLKAQNHISSEQCSWMIISGVGFVLAKDANRWGGPRQPKQPPLP
jgi:uncharacterized membrane protein